MLFEALGELVEQMPEPLDIDLRRKPAREREALEEAEEIVREALMLGCDDLPRRLSRRAAEARLRTEQIRLAREALAVLGPTRIGPCRARRPGDEPRGGGGGLCRRYRGGRAGVGRGM